MPKILKRSLALFLALMMCFSLVPASAFAVEDEAAVNQAEETVLPEDNQPEELPDAAEQLPAPEESPAPEEGGEEAEKAPEQEEAPVTEETPEEPEAPAPVFETVKVCFVCEAPVDLSGLTVYGSGGAVLEPYYDEDSSETSFGVYYLAPGEYTYSFHDESGVYADSENIAFTVSSAEAEQTVEIVLTEAEEEPLPGVEVHSFTYINPLYEDVVDESDIPEVEFTQEDYDEFTALIEGEAKSPKASAANGMHLFAAFNAGAGEIIHTSVADAAAELRPYLAAREPSITIAISSPTELGKVDYETLANEIFSGAAIHTGNPTEGDYLSFQYGGYGGNVSISQKGSDYIYRFTYEPLYYTTAAQEELMTLKVNSVLSGLNLSGKTEYQKIRAIYGYLCDNVRYDYANLRKEDYLLKYTGYAALVNGTAVCQGYSVAFYRLCLTAGIDARVVSSVKMNHAWNIARFADNYYELDSTWDEGKTFDNYLYFLRGSTYWISSHKYAGVSTIGDEFSNSAFKAAYNLSSSDAPKYYTVSYNANGGTGAPGPQDKQEGNSIRLSTIAPTHPRTEFLGWATTDDATDAEYQPGDTFRTDADTTLYAVWKISYIVPDGICGDELSWTLDTAGRLTVYGSGAMPDYASSADTPWHDYSDLIKLVIIDDGVTKIGKYAFRDCGSLTSVIIPASVTSIGTGAFRACGALASISVVSSNTAYSSAGNCLIEIASGKLIRGCNNSVIPAEGVTSIGDFSFDGCTGLKSITIPSTVTTIGTNAFYNCSSLTSISIPAGVTSIGTYAFLGCTALTSITVESGNTAYSGAGNCLIGKDSHTLISGCNNSVIPAEGITSISDYAFYGCSGLAGATIPEGVTSIGMQAFRGCSSLASITLPESLASIGEYAFYGCSKLASVCFNGTASQEEALRSGTLTGNNTLLNIKWVTLLKDKGTCGDNVSWKLDANGLLTISGTGAMADYGSADAPWYKYCSLIKSAIIENGVTTIGDNAFWGCTELSSITIPDSVTSIGDYAFAHSSLASITLPESLTSIGGFAFNGCTGLTSITIPDSVTSVSRNAFEGCSALTSISVVSGNTVYSGDGNCLIEKGSGTLILGCKNSVIPAEGVTSIGISAFYGCSNLASITIPDSVTSIGISAFYGCTGLTSITIPDSVTSIGDCAFSSCTGLTSITIPAFVETIGNNAFYGCSSLASITIPDSVTTIGTGAFEGCSNLTSITVPASVTSIGSQAFYSCSKLADVFYKGTSDEWDRITIDASGNDCLTIAKIHYSVADFGECGKNLSWVLDTNGVLTISGTGEMADYGSSSDTPWYSYRDLIKSVIIEEDVTTIGSNAFNGCISLTSITIPDSVTAIGGNAFFGCTGLTSITIPASVKSIGSYAFFVCSNLASVVFSGTEAQEKALRTGTAGGNEALLNIKWIKSKGACGDNVSWVLYPDGLLTISGTGAMADYDSDVAPWYKYCNLIKSAIIENGVTSIDSGAFCDCTGLTNITIPASVTSIGEYAFFGCSNLTSVFFNGTVAQEKALRSSTASGNDILLDIKWVTLLKDKGTCGENVSWKLDTNGVLTISGTGAMADYDFSKTPWYSYGDLIKSVIIKNGVTSIGEGAFWNCAGLTSIEIPDSVTSIGGHAFNGCTGFTSITVPYGVTSIGGFAFTGCSNLTSITIPSSVTTIGGNAFNGCKRLTSITLPEGLTTIGDGAFHGCMGLTSITIPSSVTTIGSGVLRECGTLISISVASGNTAYSGDGNCLIEKGSGTLILGCKNSVIPEGVKSIGKSAFSGCTGLTSIAIPSSVETIGSSSFERCSNLTSITVPSSVTSIGSQAFYSCSKLADVFYKGRYDEWRIISIAAGNDCLTKAKIHYSVADFGECGENLSWVLDTNGVLTISGSGAMTAYSSQSPAPWSSYKDSITSFVIEEGVTTIGTRAFYGCTGLTSVTIPGSVTSVGSAAFYGCSGLMNVYYDGTPLDWDNISIGSSNGYLKLANIICSIPFAKTVTISHDSRDITGQTVDADIYRVQTYQLTATAAPDNAKQQFTWASDSTGVASVNKSGLVSFRSPGTATITATAADGSHTGASVTFNVFYYDAAAKFTASTDAPSTGLEVNYSAQISVFGKDKTAALDPSMFEYTLSNVKNGPFIEVSDTGEITVIKPGGTTTVTAALINDPLGRTVTVSVKTVPTRTKELHIKPLDTEVIRTDDDYEDGFYAIDANGNIPFSAEEAVSYALFLNKLPKGSQKAFPLVLDATDFSDRPIPLPNTDYTWTSSNTKIATVAKDGTITIKANVDGACTITATSKDLAKAQGSIAVYVMDKTPRLDAAKVTLDVQKANTASVALVSSYGNEVDSVIFTENKSDVASTKVEVKYENELVTVTAPTFLKNQTIKGQLVVTTKYRTEPYKFPFNVVIKNSAPSVTVKQPSKFNLFYTDSYTTLNVSVKNEQIDYIEPFETDYFTGTDNRDGTVTVEFKTPDPKPATKATLKIHLVGYEQPVEKAITIGTVTTKPKLTVTPASATINTGLGKQVSEFAVYNNASGEYIDVINMTTAAEWASLTGEGTNAVLTLTGTTGGKAAISVQESNWASPITVYHTVNVKATNPVAKLGTGTLTLNSNFLNIAETTLTLDQANVSITGINKDLTSVPKGVDKDAAGEWFYILYESGELTAEFSPSGKTAIGSGALKTGTYSFSITPYVEGVDLNPVTLKISVKNTIPTVTASAVTLNKRLSETGVSTLKLSAAGYTVTGAVVSESNPNLYVTFNNGTLTVKLNSEAKALKAQTFSVTLTPTVRMDGYEAAVEAKPFTLKVSMIDKAPSASVSASGKIDVIVKGSGITYTLTKLSNAVGSVSSAELTGDNADLFTLTKLEPNDKGQPRYMLTLKDDAVCATNVTYKIKLGFTLDSGDVIETSMLNVKPSQSSLKLTATPAAQIFYQSQSRDRVVTYTVKLTSPAGAEIGSIVPGKVSFWQNSLADQTKKIVISLDPNDKSVATVAITLKDTARFTSGKSYTLPLEVRAAGYAENTSVTKLNLTLKVME